MGKTKGKQPNKLQSAETVRGPVLDQEDQEALCRLFGFRQLYPHQITATAAMAGGSDLLLLAGTSYGKTEAVLGSSILHPEEGLAVMIELLRVLQADMLKRLEKLGLDAILLNSDLSDTEYRVALAAIKDNRIHFVLTTPEQLEKKRVFQVLNDAGVSTVIVDEVHCLLDYGGDFRPAYDRIGVFIQHLKQRPVVAACTATLAPDSIKKVQKPLGMKQPVLIHRPSDRPEIRQNVVEIGTELACNQQDLVEKERLLRLKQLIEQHIKKGDAAIVYCNTVGQTKQVSMKLRKKLGKKGYRVATFYADMPAKEKKQVMEEFQSDAPPIVVATSAFGMGIDKSNVRLVVHMSMPLSIEDYWQKIGRAGRDGNKSHSYVFWYHGDYQTNKRIIGNDTINLHKLDQLREFLESADCCVQMLRSYFGENTGKRCKHCSKCKK